MLTSSLKDEENKGIQNKTPLVRRGKAATARVHVCRSLSGNSTRDSALWRAFKSDVSLGRDVFLGMSNTDDNLNNAGNPSDAGRDSLNVSAR